jgi:predicted AAA+ superfamily ATPase
MPELFQSLSACNYWEGPPTELGLVRPEYLDLLIKATGNSLIKVLVGQRRSGKSYLFRQLIHHLIVSQHVPPTHIFYLNKEMLEFDSIRTYQDLQALIQLYEDRIALSSKTYLFLDEIQEIQGWEKAINAFSQNPKKKYEVFITGSNSTLLSGELASHLSGRYIAFEIAPFSYQEFCLATEQPRSKQSYLAYLQSGGLPELFHLHDEEIKRHYVHSLYSTIILKDIVARHKIKDSHLLETLFKYLANNVGNLSSIVRIVDTLQSLKMKTNHETVSSYIQYLMQCFLFHEAERYDLKGNTILSNTKKYYLNDLAFKHYFSSGFDPGFSKRLENAVYLHFKRKGYTLYVGKIGDQEIDFVAEKGQDKIYVQIAFSLQDEKVAQREFGNLEKIRDSHKKIVVSLDDVSFGNRGGIEHVLAWTLV